jgi:ABC-2 type transport system ATP-binding protein
VGILRQGQLVHLQHMTELRQANLIRARFPQPPGSLPNLHDLQLREQHDGQVTLEYSGPLPPLLDWLARQAVVDLRVEPLGLSPIYRRFHGAEHG